MNQIDVEPGMVIQANENAGDWCGCLLIVEEIKGWGVMAGLKIPQKGTAYIRLKNEQFEVIGNAVLIPDIGGEFDE